MTLGQRIQELRKQNNLSQEALGEKLGVSRQAISRWEMDGAVPEVDKLIAEAESYLNSHFGEYYQAVVESGKAEKVQAQEKYQAAVAQMTMAAMAAHSAMRASRESPPKSTML